MTTNTGKEKISAFLDNEIHQDELMSFSLSSEPEDAKVAQRYQMVGEVLRDDLGDASFVDVSQAVREALADEVVEPTRDAASKQSEKVSAGWDLSSWFRPAAGMVTAGLVAVVMVVTLSSQESDGLSPVADNSIDKPAVMTADVKEPAVKPAAENAEDLQPYVNQHLEYATQDTLQGRLPFVRAVSYGTEK